MFRLYTFLALFLTCGCTGSKAPVLPSSPGKKARNEIQGGSAPQEVSGTSKPNQSDETQENPLPGSFSEKNNPAKEPDSDSLQESTEPEGEAKEESKAASDVPNGEKEDSDEMKQCKVNLLYFDLLQKTCTTRKLAKFICDVKHLTDSSSKVFSDSKKELIKSYLDAKPDDYIIFACVDDENSYALILAKGVGTEQVKVRTLTIPK